MLGLLYRQYQFCDSKSLKQMYISLVRPHLEYAAQVWDPHLQQNIDDIERVQKFALRICSKEWGKEYTELLDNFKLPTLQNRRLYLKICHLYKIIHGLCYFSSDIIIPNTTLTHSTRSLILNHYFTRTNSFYNSFMPSSVRLWNLLPEYSITTPNFTLFKQSIKCLNYKIVTLIFLVLFVDLYIYITLIYLYFNFTRIHYILYFMYFIFWVHLIISLAIVYPMLLRKLLYV